MKKLHIILLISFILYGLAGCEKATIVDQATADAFIQSIKNPTDTAQVVFAVVHSVFSYNRMTSVTVIAPITAASPDSITTNLINYANMGNSFYNNPVYSVSLPTPGSYTYDVTFKDGQAISFNNTLTYNILIPPNITFLAKNATPDSIDISWNAVTNAQAYQVKVTKGTLTGPSAIQVFYVAPFIDLSSPLRTNLTIGVPLSTVLSYGAGTYTFEVDALLYESTVGGSLQAIGTSTQAITL